MLLHVKTTGADKSHASTIAYIPHIQHRHTTNKHPIDVTDEQSDTAANFDSDFAPLFRDCEHCEVSQLSDWDRVRCPRCLESRAFLLHCC